MVTSEPVPSERSFSKGAYGQSRESPLYVEPVPSERYFSKVGAVAAITGITVYAVSKVMHPGVPPNLTRDAFAAYAADPHYPIEHLGELLGILLMTAAFLALAWRLRRGTSGVWVILGGAAMVVSATVNAVLMAVDGIALYIVVKQWAAAEADQQELLYQTAYAIRQIEGGLISIQWFMFGIAAVLFAAAFFASADSLVRFDWFSGMGWLSLLASVGAFAFGIVHAQTGFSVLSNTFETGLFLGVLWIIAVGVFLYRNPVQTDTTP